MDIETERIAVQSFGVRWRLGDYGEAGRVGLRGELRTAPKRFLAPADFKTIL